MKTILFLAVLLSVVPLTASAQSSRCDRMPTEEEYQRCIERQGSPDEFDPRDIGAGSGQSPPQDFDPSEPPPVSKPIDTLPPESRRHVQQQMAKNVYAKVGQWTPEAKDQDFEFEPSEAAQGDAALSAQEEEAFADAVEAYHQREQVAYEAANGASAGNGSQGEQGDGSPASSGGGNVAVSGSVNERGQPGQAGGGSAGGQSRSVLEILGDLTAIGNGNGQGQNAGGEPGQAGSQNGPMQIDGDVVINRDGASGGGGGQQNGSSGQGQGAANGGGGGQDGPSDNQVAGGQGPADGAEQASLGGGEEAERGTTGNPAQTAETESQQSGAPQQQDSSPQPAEPPGQPRTQQAGAEQQSSGTPALPNRGEPSDGPPPTPPRPIPSAAAIAAEMLAKLFSGEAEDDDNTFSDAPFVDWSNPRPGQGVEGSSADIERAAQEATATVAPQTQSPPAPDPEGLARQIAKEEDRLAALEAQDAPDERLSQTQTRIDDLRETQPPSMGTPQEPTVSVSAARRIAIMELP